MREEEHGVGIVDDRLVVFRVYNVGHILDDQPDAAVLFSDRFVQVFDEISEVRIIEEFPCLVEPEDFIFRGGFGQYFLGHEHNQIKYNFVD